MLKLDTRQDITCLISIENIGVVLGQEEGCIDILSLFYGQTSLVQEIHPFCDKISWLEKTSRTEVCEIATVTAGQIFFANVEIKQKHDSDLQEASKVVFELDELYIDEDAQLTKVHEFEPEKFIAFSWWINKIYIFKRSINFLMGNNTMKNEFV